MGGHSSRGGTRALPRRIAGRIERRLFPEAGSASEHWQRRVMYEDVDRRIAEWGGEGLRAVEISGTNHASKPWSSYTSLMFPDFDICAPLGDRDTYDVVICEQVLEHVPDPWAAARNLHALCAPNGRAIVSTPFMIRVHELPEYGLEDYWRFTPRGLRRLLEAGGFEDVAVRSWGNRECVVGNMRRWSAYRRWMPLADDPDLPVQVWAFASARVSA